MSKSTSANELSRKYGGNNNVVHGIQISGPNPDEKIRVTGNITRFYRRYSDGTTTLEVWTEIVGGVNIDKEIIDNTVVWESL